MPEETSPMTDEPKTFGETLSRARLAANLKRGEVASLCGVTYKAVKMWERGENLPVGENYQKLVGMFPSLGRFAQIGIKMKAKPAVGVPAHVVSAAMAAISQRSQTFPAALRKVREAEAISQDQLGELMGVGGRVISQWELGECRPIKMHYDRLCDLFPRLKEEPEPDWKDIPKPKGNTTGNPHVDHAALARAAASIKPAPATPTPEPKELPMNQPARIPPTPTPIAAVPAPQPSARDWVGLLVRVRAVENAGCVDPVVAMLADAQKLGVTIDELVLMLKPSP